MIVLYSEVNNLSSNVGILKYFVSLISFHDVLKTIGVIVVGITITDFL